MQPEHWRQIDQLFHLALDKARDERALFLAEVCAGDEVLRTDKPGKTSARIPVLAMWRSIHGARTSWKEADERGTGIDHSPRAHPSRA